MSTPVRSHLKFLIAGKIGVNRIESVFEANLDSMQQLSDCCPFDSGIYGRTITTTHDFQWVRKRNRGNKTKGTAVTEGHRIYLHLFLNKAKAEYELATLSNEIRTVQKRLISGVEQLSSDEKRTAEKYLVTGAC